MKFRFASSPLLRSGGFIAIAIACLSFHASAEVRTWTSADGDRTFEAELIAYEPDAGTVTVRRTDGETITFLNTVLSDDDNAFLSSVGAIAPPAADNAAGGTAPTGSGGDGSEPADMSKPVQVFILMGQSNMLGFGQVAGDKDGTLENAVKSKDLYPYLVDDEGNWTTRKDVRNVFVMNNNVRLNSWLTAGEANTGKIGPDLGIGWQMGGIFDAPVLILKSCIGNRSLGWDLLPPGTEAYEVDGKLQPGYGETPDTAGSGEKHTGDQWYAGKQWDTDIAGVRQVLDDLDTFYPGATGYEIAGFFWWQGDKDMRNGAHAAAYEQNLVKLINALREEFDAPNAKFVCATLGQTKQGAGGNDGRVLDAKFAVADATKYPEFKGNVATVYSNPLSKGGSSGGHYGNNAETYMNVGVAMGEAMVELLTGE